MIIATRVLTAISTSGQKKPFNIRIEAPVEEQGMWRCWYEMDYPEDDTPAHTRRAFGAGEDALAALQMALMKLGVDLHFTSYHLDGKLYWEEGREGYGVLVPKNARDLLKGDDAQYFG